MVEHVYYDYDKKIECKELIELKPSKDMNAKKIINRFVCDWQDGNLYRGINNRANLYSKLSNNGGNSDDKIRTLDRYLKRFKKYINGFTTNTKDVDLLIKFQHYGGATNLIDFTYNPLVALFFCLARDKKESEMYEVISFSKKDYNMVQDSDMEDETKNKKSTSCKDSDKSGNRIQSAIENNSENCSSTVSVGAKVNYGKSSNNVERFSFNLANIIDYKPTDNDTITILEPFVYTNHRIINQQGVFCLTSLEFEKEETLKFILKNATVYRIDETFRVEILKILEALGFDEVHLFPDLQGLVEHAVSKY